MDLLVSSFLLENELINGKDTINNLNAILKPHSKSLTAKQRIGIRSVGNSRYGLVKIAERIALQYESKLSKEDNAVDLAVRVSYLEKIRQYKIAVLALFEMLDDTDKALGQDIMNFVSKFSKHLDAARIHDGDLDEALKDLDDYNSRFGASMEAEDETPETPKSATPLTLPTTTPPATTQQ